MKAISIPQPYASLIASGIADVDNRTWTTDYRGPILIVAPSRRMPAFPEEDMLVEWAMSVNLAQTFGLIPEYEDMPRCAIIGWAELYDVKEYPDEGDDLSPWSNGLRYRLCFKNAHLFRSPIPVPRARPRIYDYDKLSPNTLPDAIIPQWPTIHQKDYHATIPCAETRLDEILQASATGLSVAFWLDQLSPHVDPLFRLLGQDQVLLPLKTLILRTPTREVPFTVENQYTAVRTYEEDDDYEEEEENDEKEEKENEYKEEKENEYKKEKEKAIPITLPSVTSDESTWPIIIYQIRQKPTATNIFKL